MRTALVWLFRHIVDIYFLSIESTGVEPSHDTGGRLFVSNHVNGLVDPLLVLTRAPCAISPVAKSTLWNIPGLRALLDAANAVPIVRRRDDPNKKAGANEAAFDRIASWLGGGGNILIFPEGTSHNEPYVLKVRSGAARMLVRSFRAGATNVTFQAVALEFDARDVFRSRCLLVYGPVRDVASLAGDAAGDAAERDDERLVQAITRHIQDDLEELIVEGATWEEHLLVARVAEMLAHDGGDHTLAAWNEIGRQVEAANKALAGVDDERVDVVRSAVGAYYELLDKEGLRDQQVASAERGTGPAGSWLSLALLPLALPIAAVGVVLFWLPYQAPRLVARTAAEPDVVSTYKLGTALVLFPLWAAGLVTLALLLLPPPFSWLAAVLAVSSPFFVLVFADRSRPFRWHLRALRKGGGMAPLMQARAAAMKPIRETQQLLEERPSLLEVEPSKGERVESIP